MVNSELNNRVNALWAQFPDYEVESLREKFYGYIATGKTEKLKQLILEHPIMKEIAVTDPSIIWGSALHYHHLMIEYMVNELGLDVNFRRQEAINRTLLLEVLHQHHKDCRDVNLSIHYKYWLKCQTIAVLIKLGADVNAVDYLYNNSLQYAINCIRTKDLLDQPTAIVLMEILLDAGANPNLQNFHGQTALHSILFKREMIPLHFLEPIIKQLIGYGADENITDNTGTSPKVMVLRRSPVMDIGQEINRYLP